MPYHAMQAPWLWRWSLRARPPISCRATRPSSGGRYVSVTVRIVAETRAHYDAAHEALRAHPAVKWTL